ncbi:hypothetical protein [uncultured Microscilla sp.]|uniref:helix-turn-helix transcriptional regulator n=1 Tax=uncultured Microscilla sp. TaxID=432653 RepID=UPI002632AF15|nr:hypothetical protein [uncultured Microscilla sp.]
MRALAQKALEQNQATQQQALHTRWLTTQHKQAKTIQTLEDKIVSQNQQLASYSLHKVRNHQALQEIRQLVKTILQQNDFRSAKKHYQKLDSLVNFSLNLDKDWESFLYIFDQLHPQFYAALLHQFPTLNKSDLHLCALIKLNLATDEIARLLAISEKSVHMRYYRLRKKMAFDSSCDLYNFMLNFGAAA